MAPGAYALAAFVSGRASRRGRRVDRRAAAGGGPHHIRNPFPCSGIQLDHPGRPGADRPMVARLWVGLDGCDDANLFVGVEKWRDGRFVEFEGSYGYGRDRVTTGWQRIALGALAPELAPPREPVPGFARPQPR